MDRQSEQNRRDLLQTARRIVVKVGSNVLTAPEGLNLSTVQSLSDQINRLIEKGIQVVLVSSGAMASGQKKIGLARRPDEIPKRQAIAAVGQAGLILAYENAFSIYKRSVAQVLLTSDDLSGSRRRYLNARNTLYTLLSWQVLPIINENDTVVVEEIKFGDNDNLSALITLMMNADILINLTDIDGLYTADPRSDKKAQLIEEVGTISSSIEKIAGDIPGALGTGGMTSKIRAARKVTTAGIPMIIANGKAPEILDRLASGDAAGTFFTPAKDKLSNRKCWIGFTVKPKGVIKIDEGAVYAIKQNGKSLLPGGIREISGEFGPGAPVEVQDAEGRRLAVGLVNYSAGELKKIRGCNSSEIRERLGHKPYDEVIHRDNLTVFDHCSTG
ncbi:MAG: glutamate 5-kinase [Desulfosalsimonadaceae bacterium]